MKILLVNPPSTHTISAEIPEVVREGGKMPPLGLLYLQAVLRRADHEAHFLDAGNSTLTAAETAREASRLQVQAVGLTATSYQMVDARETLRAVREAMPGVFCFLGGPHASMFPRQTARLPEVDAAFIGESERSLPRFLAASNGALPKGPMPGVMFTRDGQLIGDDRPDEPVALDQLPFPERGDLKRNLYGDVAVERGPLATVSTGRGCPFNCTFCSTPGEPVRLRNPEQVADELEELAGQGYRDVYFVDDTFNIDTRRAQAICEELIRRRLNLTWTCRARLDRLPPELLAVLYPAGCRRMQLGVEASTSEGMAVLGKKITPVQAAEAVRRVRGAKVAPAAYFLLGTPVQRTVRDLRRTVVFAIDIDPDYAVFNVLTPYPTTELYRQGVERGVLDAQRWEKFVNAPEADFHPPVWTEFLSPEVLYRELVRAYRRFYYRPRVVGRQIQRLDRRNAWTILKRALQILKR